MTVRHERQDRGELLAESSAANTFTGVAARVHVPGDGLRYQHDGLVVTHEYRDDAELRRIVEQLPGKRLELEHGGPTIGVVLEARLDAGRAVVVMRVDSRSGLEAIRSGTRELSLDYRVILDERNYQRETEVRALALVPRGRCGSQCRITDRADCDDARRACACHRDVLETEREAADRLRARYLREWTRTR